MKFVISILFLCRVLFAGNSISDHLTEVDGLERSIESAEEEIAGLKKKAQEEKNLEKKILIKKDITNLEKSIKMFKDLEQKVVKHVMLEHSKKDRQEFNKNMENRAKFRQQHPGGATSKKKWP